MDTRLVRRLRLGAFGYDPMPVIDGPMTPLDQGIERGAMVRAEAGVQQALETGVPMWAWLALGGGLLGAGIFLLKS